MKQKMELFALNLPKPLLRRNIEAVLGISLKKGIEATFFAQIDDALITFTQFNVLTIINWPRAKIIETLKALGVDNVENFQTSGIYQDYPIIIDSDNTMPFSIDNDTITLREYSRIHLIIAAHVISQSVALELYETKLSDYYEKSRTLINEADTYSIFKRRKMASFAKQLVLIRHDMLIDLYLLDKPNILWDNEDAEMLYNSLAYILELKERFEVVEYKLNSIKDDIVMVMDLTNHNHSSFLEWIIIVLIGVEIVMGLMKSFG